MSETARKTKKGRSTIAHRLTRAKKIVVLADIANTSLDERDEVEALAKLPAEEQRKLADKAQAGEKVSAKGAAKNYQRKLREEALGEKTRAALAKLDQLPRYPVIYIDPPWRFEPYSRETGLDRAADNHYPTMTFEELCALKIPAAADCIMFMWATAPMDKIAQRLLEFYGFDYRTDIIWDKGKLGTGFWVRGQHEALLLGVKGNVPAPAPGTQPPSVIRAKPGRHSEKPEIFAEIIEKMFPTLPKLEMFARKQRPGWTTWGNEVEDQ